MHWMLLPLRRYADFRGRSRRMEFWMWVLLQTLVYIVLAVILFATIGAQRFGQGNTGPDTSMTMLASFGVFGVVLVVLWLATLLPNIAVQVRRLHDQDRSGWWVMLWGGPLILSYVVIGMASVSAASTGGLGTGVMVVNSIISLIGLVGDLVLLVFYCLPGTRGPNRFGPDPLDPNATADLSEVFS